MTTPFSFASISFSFIAEIHTSSMSSLFVSSGASMRSFKAKPGFSKSYLYFVMVSILCQCLCFIALLDMSSNIGHMSLKSSMIFLRS